MSVLLREDFQGIVDLNPGITKHLDAYIDRRDRLSKKTLRKADKEDLQRTSKQLRAKHWPSDDGQNIEGFLAD